MGRSLWEANVLKSKGKQESATSRRLDPKVLLCGASALALIASTPGVAQDTAGAAASADAQPEDEIVVRGIRRSLQNAQAIKQNADTFVDAITAEDIGALPDRSVTEALQRLPGIAISRFAAADDPDHFSIEGQGVVVRGLTYVRSELNGRDTFSANNGRALSFADVPPELLGSVQVFKNQTSDLIEGGIAGSINLVTRKPFDQSGALIAGSAEYNYSDFRGKGAPTFSGLVSNRWETDIGEFGLLANGVYSKLKTRSDGTQISSFQARDDLAPNTVWVPEGAVVRSQDYDRKRIGYGGSAQWESPDQTMQATFEFLRSEATTSWNEHASEIATDNVGDTAFFFVPGTEFGFDDQDLLTYGTISAPVGWRSDQNTPPPAGQRTPIYGLQSNNIFRGVEQEYVTQDISFNFKWTPTDRLRFNFDYQRIKSTVDNVDFGLWGSSYQDVALDLRGKIPNVTFLAPNEVGPAGGPNAVNCAGGTSNTCPNYFDAPNDSFANPFNSFWRAAMDHFEDSGGKENAFRADVDYDLDEGGWLKSVRVGGRYAERDQTTRFSTYNWGALSEIWGNGGPVWYDEVGGPEGLIENFAWEDYHRGKTVTPPAFPFFALNPAQNYGAAADFADSVVSAWLSGGTPGGGSGGWRRLTERENLADGIYTPGEISDVVEESWAGYVKFNYGFDNFLGSGMTLDGNFGVRYVHTSLTSTGAFQFPDADADLPQITGLPQIEDPDNPNYPGGAVGDRNQCLPPIEDDGGAGPGTPQAGYTAPGFCSVAPDLQALYLAFSTNGFEERNLKNDYDVWLPSFNAKLGLNDDMLIRFAYSRSIARPDVGLLRGSVDITVLSQDDPRTPGGDPVPGGSGFFGFTANTGQPFLKPIKAHNFDLSYEWYFAEVGSLTVSAFYKIIDDIIVSGAGDVELTNEAGVTVDNVYLRQPTNSNETGKIKGFEIAHQQFYDFLPGLLNGFGTQLTYTFIDSTGVPSAGVNATNSAPGGNGSNDPLIDLSDFPLEGLSKHNVNASLIYEKGPISTRVSYNWRSDYLVTARDVITPFYPIFQNSTGQVDASFFYTVNENIKIGVQAANILNEITETESYIPDSGDRRGARSFFENDRRVTASVRASF